MKTFTAVLKLLFAVALLPFALDWRSPFLAGLRAWAFVALVVSSSVLLLIELQALRRNSTGQRMLRRLNALTLLACVVVLFSTLALEARFHWVRYQVLYAEPSRLEKLGRHLIVGYRDQGEALELVRLRAVAGVFISSRNVRGKSVREIRQETESLQSERRRQGLPPLWIATDQEGGVVSRMSPPLTSRPPISEIVASHADISQCERGVREFARLQGQELSEVGVNLNFAPVVDINHQVKNPSDRFTRIFKRAISNDPEVVSQVADWYCASLEEAGVRCTLKHFPGLGRVFEDTHLSRANLSASLIELENTDWLPFRVLMSKTGAFTMIGHVRLTAADPERPASASFPVISGILRGDWKHDGVLITDDFGMLAVYRSPDGIDNSSIAALNAGIDLILVSYDSDQYYRVMYALLNADREGALNPDTLQRSDKRLARAIRTIQR